MNNTKPLSDFAITGAMIQCGGGFVELLGDLWRHGDADNQARLKAAFPEYWEKYEKIARFLEENK